MREATVEELAKFLKKQLEEKPVVPLVEQMVRDHSSLAGTSREGIFTREFLCPAIRDFYTQVCQNLNLHADEIHKNLQMEGFKTVKGFGSTPASKRMHLFTKDLVIKSEPPESWYLDGKHLAAYKACPDFAICQPLLRSATVGEVKYFESGSPKHAVQILYDASRQALFYLGAFTGTYQSAIIVVADASRDHAFFEALKLTRPELLRRFGTETDIHLVPIKLM
jgi:hypothetical protein